MTERIHVLIVDDDAADRRMVRRALLGDGVAAEIEEADDVTTGLTALRSRPFDCAFIDYNLPDDSGLTLLRQARAAGIHTPIIMLTGQGDESVAVQAIKSGATDYVTKDKAASAISHSLRSALRLHESEKRRRQAEEDLRENQERFRLLIEGAKEYAIFMMDTEGRVASWNPGAERIFGYTDRQILGQPSDTLFLPEDEQAGLPEQERRTALHTGKADDTRWLRRRDGTRFWAEGVLTALHDSQGRLRGYEKVLRDATDRKQAEEAVAQAHRSQRTFLRDVLASVTDGRLRLCESRADLPGIFDPEGPPIPLTPADGLAELRRKAEDVARREGFADEPRRLRR